MVLHETTQAPGLSGRLYRFLVAGALNDNPAAHQALLDTIFHQTASLAVGLVTTTLTAGLAYALTHARWPLVWLAADYAISAVRWRVTLQGRRRPAAERTWYHGALMILGCLWATVFGLAAHACVLSGRPALLLMAGLNTAGVVTVTTLRNAPTPRYGAVIMALQAVPFALAALRSPAPGSDVVALAAVLLGLGMRSTLSQNHAMTARLFTAEWAAMKAAYTDALTGLDNRMSLHERLSAMSDRVAHDPTAPPFSVLCLDLDGFKRVNDVHGHPVGDRLLAAVADRLREATRQADAVCRLGGDEFVILLPGTDPSAAAVIAHRVIDAVHRPFDLGMAAPIQVGVSVGGAFSASTPSTPAEILGAGDRALYAAKAAGKGVYRAQPA